mgnify:CR=1 FL=1
MTPPFDFPLGKLQNVLILSVSAKGGLVNAFVQSKNAGRVIGVDTDPYAPAGLLCHAFHAIPPQDDPTCAARIREICEQEHIGLMVPTREADIYFLNKVFPNAEIPIAGSSEACIELCEDKWKTQKWLAGRQFPTPPTVTAEEAKRALPFPEFPLIAKSPTGSGSREVRMIRKPQDLEYIPDNWLVQPLLAGKEYTLNTYVDRTGHCTVVIPHLRMATDAGEVSRGITERNPMLIDLARDISESLPGAYGPLTIQAFWDHPTGALAITDINPRFGGGYPLAHAAGGHFTEWLLAEAQGITLPQEQPHWQENLMMLRYRESLFTTAENKPIAKHPKASSPELSYS